MAKLKRTPTAVADLEEYLRDHSDFGFELEVLRRLRELGVRCEHGGLYEDPVTNKSREFDIRATVAWQDIRVRLAIECKNLRQHFPVFILCVPRHVHESYHAIALVSEPTGGMHDPAAFKSRARVLQMRDDASMYSAGDPVGKSVTQVGRALDHSIVANDGEFHEKWGQCLASAQDLLDRMYEDGSGGSKSVTYFGAVFPLLVVPDGTLWTAVFDDNGQPVQAPKQVERCPCFVAKEYRLGSNIAGTTFVVSHIEIVTISGLAEFVSSYLKDEAVSRLFPRQGIIDAISRQTRE